jgi:flagellar hook-basal body complex protein FliE
MSILPVGGVTATDFLAGLSGVAAPGATTSATPGGEASFAASFAGSIDNLQALQSTSDALAVKAVTGDLDDIHDFTIASTQASVALELTAALRNKAVDAFTEIMRMQA